MEPGSSETSLSFGVLLKKLHEDIRKIVRNIENVQRKINNGECALAFNLVCLQEYIYLFFLFIQ